MPRDPADWPRKTVSADVEPVIGATRNDREFPETWTGTRWVESEQLSDLRDYLRANLFDGDEGGTFTSLVKRHLDAIVDNVIEWLHDATEGTWRRRASTPSAGADSLLDDAYRLLTDVYLNGPQWRHDRTEWVKRVADHYAHLAAHADGYDDGTTRSTKRPDGTWEVAPSTSQTHTAQEDV